MRSSKRVRRSGSLIDRREIDNLPTIGRDFADLAKLAPGVTSSGQAAMGFSASGQRQFQNNVFVDGASNAMQFYGLQSESYPQDWVQEFQVMTNGFSAEFGQATGAVLNVITRSGTNTVQGRAYGFVRDDKFDTAPYAGRFVNGQPEFLSEPPQFNQQRFGGFLGAPITKDKLFFFGGYENFENDATTVLAISDYWRNRGEAAVIPSKNTTRALLLKGDWNASDRNRFSLRHSRTMKEDQNCSGQGGDGCNSSPLWTLEKRATFNGPIWSVLGTWTSTLSSYRVQRDARLLRREQDPHHLESGRHVGPRSAAAERVDGTIHRAHVSGCVVWRGDNRRARRRDRTSTSTTRC